MSAKPLKKTTEKNDQLKKKTLFDHVKHIRQNQTPDY